MIISPSRERDRRILVCMLEIMAVCLKRNDIEGYSEFAAKTARLRERIAKYDYRAEDEEWTRLGAFSREWQQLTHPPERVFRTPSGDRFVEVGGVVEFWPEEPVEKITK